MQYSLNDPTLVYDFCDAIAACFCFAAVMNNEIIWILEFPGYYSWFSREVYFCWYLWDGKEGDSVSSYSCSVFWI